MTLFGRGLAPWRSEAFQFSHIVLGKGLNATLAFLVSALLARYLGAADFGLFSLSVTIAIITLELVGSEAIDNALVRFASRFLGDDRAKTSAAYGFALRLKVGLVCLVIPLLAVLAAPIAVGVLGQPAAERALVYGVIAGGATSLSRYGLAVLQSAQRFRSYAVALSAPNVAKVGGIALLLGVGALDLRAALVLNVIAGVGGFVTALVLAPEIAASVASRRADVRRAIVDFSKWLVVANLLYAVYTRLDIVMLTHFLTPADVGTYSVAIILIQGLDLLYTSWLVFLLPRASRIGSRQEFAAYFRRSLRISLLLAAVVAPLYLAAGPIIRVAFSAEYAQAVPVFRILLVGFLFVMTFNPLLLTFYANNRPQLLVPVHLLLVAIAASGHVVAIPAFGLLGAATVTAATRVVGALLILLLSLRELNRAAAPSRAAM